GVVWVFVLPFATPRLARAQVLHEPVTIGTLQCAGGVCTSSGGQVRAIDQDGQMLYAPAGEAQPRPGEQIFAPPPDRQVERHGASEDVLRAAPGDPPPERRDVIHTDRDTGPEGSGARTYHLVFSPEPFPFKRMTALDDVRIQPCRRVGGDASMNCD